jgi:hypothetical protein
MFILVLFYRYDRVIASLWIRYPVILLGEGLQLASVCLQIILWLRNANNVHRSHTQYRCNREQLGYAAETRNERYTSQRNQINHTSHHS